MDQIVIVPHDPNWTRQFDDEAKLLREVFRDQQVIVEHIGSTAVSGLSAKPVIDIMIGFENPLEVDEIIKKLESLGYEFWKEDPFVNKRQFFVKRDKTSKDRIAHVHVTAIDNDFWRNQIKFRNKLRQDPKLAEEYSLLKNELAQIYKNNRDGYTAAKTDFIKRMLSLQV